MFLALVLLAILAGLLLVVWLSAKPFYWASRNVKYQLPWPVFGHNFGMIFRGSIEVHTHLHDTFYPNERLVGVHNFRRPALVVRDPKIIQEVMVKKFDYFTSNNLGGGDPDKDMMEHHVLFSFGQRWKELRTKMSPFFTPARLKEMLKPLDTTMGKVEKYVESHGGTVDASDLCKRITTDMIVSALFSVESDAFKEESQFVRAGEDIFGPNIVKMILSMAFRKLFTALGLTIHNQTAANFLQDTLKDVMEYREKENVSKTDFLQGMIDLKKIADSKKDNDEEGNYPDGTARVRYNSTTILANCFILFAGGFETSALTLTFLLYELSRNPEAQNKCRQEIMDVLRDTGHSTIEYSDTNQLVYLRKVVQEVLRLYPSFPIMSRRCTKACNIDNESFPIEEGVVLVFPAYNIQRDPKWFPDEPDQFKPDRWDDAVPESGGYLPFGLGPRACIGQGFARAQVTLVISRILQKFKLSLNAETVNPVKIGGHFMVTKPKSPIWVDLQKV